MNKNKNKNAALIDKLQKANVIALEARLFDPTEGIGPLPAGWETVRTAGDGKMYRCVSQGSTAHGLTVIVSGHYDTVFPEKSVAAEDRISIKRWMHVSMSRRSRMPTYDDMRIVKNLFVGPDREAYQIFPQAERHVNVHAYCLHLWCCLDGNALPDFTKWTGTI